MTNAWFAISDATMERSSDDIGKDKVPPGAGFQSLFKAVRVEDGLQVAMRPAAAIALFIAASCSAIAMSPTAMAIPGLSQTTNGAHLITDIDAFLTSCPQNDPATAEILSYIQFSLDRVLLDSEPCTEPVPLTVTPSPRLFYLQMLRVAYYMDQANSASGLYPWTSGGYWAWIRSKIGGINIISNSSGGSCCYATPGRLPTAYLAGPSTTVIPYWFALDVLARLALLLSHEVRHADGHPHVACVSGSGAGLWACDQDFDLANLSAYGVAWWMDNLFETGRINIGLSCKPTTAQIASIFLNSENSLGSNNFVGNKPPVAVPSPVPGGPCLPAIPQGFVLEFYNTNLDNYFITADPSEAAAIDNGSAGPGWSRTGNSFKTGGTTPVCRFYGSLSPGPHSHFYTVDPGECANLKQIQASTLASQKRWNFENLDFFSTPAANGACPSWAVPVYRAYNNGFVRGVDSNHRITSSQTAIQQVLARGWINEGVVMCAPN